FHKIRMLPKAPKRSPRGERAGHLAEQVMILVFLIQRERCRRNRGQATERRFDLIQEIRPAVLLMPEDSGAIFLVPVMMLEYPLGHGDLVLKGQNGHQ